MKIHVKLLKVNLLTIDIYMQTQYNIVVRRRTFEMTVKVAINGFGRIGRLAFRQMFGAEGYEVHKGAENAL